MMVKQKATSPIGIFDSGLGGLSILSEIHKRLPLEDIIYIADSCNAPYGEKPQKEIIELSIKNTEYLLSKSCKIIVVACNTATTNAIDVLRKKFDVPFIGIEPAIKPAAIQSQTGVIGILATRGTLTSSLFSQNAKKLSQNTKIVEVIGKGIVEAIESNTINTNEFNSLLSEQLEPFKSSNIDHLVLGCSHFPFITQNISAILGDKIKIIDSGFAVAKQTENILDKYNLKYNSQRDNNKNLINILTNKTSISALKSILNRLKLKNYTIN